MRAFRFIRYLIAGLLIGNSKMTPQCIEACRYRNRRQSRRILYGEYVPRHGEMPCWPLHFIMPQKNPGETTNNAIFARRLGATILERSPKRSQITHFPPTVPRTGETSHYRKRRSRVFVSSARFIAPAIYAGQDTYRLINYYWSTLPNDKDGDNRRQIF